MLLSTTVAFVGVLSLVCCVSSESACVVEDYTRCPGGRCISNSWFCDGRNDCEDKSDENPSVCASIPKQCAPGQVKCPNKPRCIPEPWLCDGDNDCGNNWDEENCAAVSCEENEFQCLNRNTCLRRFFLCDGVDHCGDNSDEDPEMCRSFAANCGGTRWRCPNRPLCLRRGRLCDDSNDCGDDSDENPETCRSVSDSMSCKSNRWKCPNRPVCIRRSSVCDGENDCGDNSDENHESCNVALDCQEGYVKCPNKPLCIHNSWICDGDNDCGDNWDEQCEQNVPTEAPTVACLRTVHSTCIMPVINELGDLDMAGMREKILSTNLREVCRPIIPVPQCIQTTLNEQCTDEAREEALRVIGVTYATYETVINYICVENVEVFEAHKQCLIGEREGETIAAKVSEQCRHLATESSRCLSKDYIGCGFSVIRSECGAEIAQHVYIVLTKLMDQMGCLTQDRKREDQFFLGKITDLFD